MLRKIGYSLLVAGALFSANVVAMDYSLAPKTSLEFTLPPGNPQEFSNHFFWTITAVCEVLTNKNVNMDVKLLNKTARVGGNSLPLGQSWPITILVGKQLEISADPGAKVSLTNKEDFSLSAVCWTK